MSSVSSSLEYTTGTSAATAATSVPTFCKVTRLVTALGFAPDHTYPHFMHVLSPKSLRVRHFGHVWNSIAAACSCPCASCRGGCRSRS